MNGRVYDQNLGRFLSADPIVQSPYNLQSYNRYSYGWNNPLNAIDPSGFTLLEPNFDRKDKNDGFDFDSKNHNNNDRGSRGDWGNRSDLDDRIGIDFDRMFDSRPSEAEVSSHVNNAGRYDNVADYAAENGNYDGILRDKPRDVVHINPDDFDTWVYNKIAEKLNLSATTVKAAGLFTNFSKSLVKGLSKLGSKLGSLFTKNDPLLDQARAARDALSTSAAKLSNSKRPATVTAGYNTKTGEVVAKACGGGKCAEDHVVDALGGKKKDVKFTEAVRPRTGKQVPVCTRCENSYGRDPFPHGTTLFQSDN